jgi:hypothetical protein
MEEGDHGKTRATPLLAASWTVLAPLTTEPAFSFQVPVIGGLAFLMTEC